MQYASVYGLQKKWVTDHAKDGWLAMNIEAHDIPIDRPPTYHRQQETGPLHFYWNIGNDDRNQSYYLRMYLSCYRAVESLALLSLSPTAPIGTAKRWLSLGKDRAGNKG